MNEEEKKLLLKDLCGRIPYGVMLYCKLNGNDNDFIKRKLTSVDFTCSEVNGIYKVENVRPYLRPFDDLTLSEANEYYDLCEQEGMKGTLNPIKGRSVEWLLAHHIDFHCLIPNRLAVDVTDNKDLRNLPHNVYKE